MFWGSFPQTHLTWSFFGVVPFLSERTLKSHAAPLKTGLSPHYLTMAVKTTDLKETQEQNRNEDLNTYSRRNMVSR